MNQRLIRRWACIGLLGLVLAGPATAANDALGYLSWEAGERVLERESLVNGARQIYLTVESSVPLDSLGFYLRWVARDPGTRIAVSEIHPVGDATWRFTPGATVTREGGFAPLSAYLSDPGFLKQATERTAAGKWRIQIAIAMELTDVLAARWEASDLTVKLASGEIFHLGSPSVYVGKGWMLRMQPLITSIEGILNQRFIKSRIYVEGYDLDRLVRFVLLDGEGARLHPARVAMHTPERMELLFVTKSVAMGRCDVEIGNPEGGLDTLRAAVEARILDYRQPGDTNMGTVPGREE